MDKTVVIFDKNTHEILACIPLDERDTICRKDISFEIFEKGAEPIFVETEHGIFLKDNSCILKL